jgi:hypothetical protein
MPKRVRHNQGSVSSSENLSVDMEAAEDEMVKLL